MLTDPRAIKALAHPARLAVIDEFFAGRKLTATECAEIAGLSASAMSYHLRALEKWGIIRRSDSSEDGRERPWEAAGGGLRLESDEPRASLAGESVLVNRLIDRQRSDALDWIGRDRGADDTWSEVMTLASHTAWLTPEEARALGQELMDLIDRYDRTEVEAQADMKRVRLTFTIVPSEGNSTDPNHGDFRSSSVP